MKILLRPICWIIKHKILSYAKDNIVCDRCGQKFSEEKIAEALGEYISHLKKINIVPIEYSLTSGTIEGHEKEMMKFFDRVRKIDELNKK